MKTAVVIPAYNAGRSIKSLLEGIEKYGLDVILVDDCSTDETPDLTVNHVKKYFRNEKQSGKGYSLRKGLFWARHNGYTGVILMDADGQHSPEDLPNFMNAIQVNPKAMIFGNRLDKCDSMPKLRYRTNVFMSGLLSFIIGQKVPDTQCGYRYLPRSFLENCRLKTDRFEIDSEILLEASRLKIKMLSVPVQTIYASETSHINAVGDTFRFIGFLFKRGFGL